MRDEPPKSAPQRTYHMSECWVSQKVFVDHGPKLELRGQLPDSGSIPTFSCPTKT